MEKKLLDMKEIKLRIMSERQTQAVSARQREVLLLLTRSTPYSIGELALTLGISSVAATKLINRLERKRLVMRTPQTHDRRIHTIQLTATGAEIARLLRPH